MTGKDLQEIGLLLTHATTAKSFRHSFSAELSSSLSARPHLERLKANDRFKGGGAPCSDQLVVPARVQDIVRSKGHAVHLAALVCPLYLQGSLF